MNRDLRRTLDDMALARTALANALAPLTAGDFDAARPGGWNVRRVLQHVIESEVIYLKLLAHQCSRVVPEVQNDEPADGAAAVAALGRVRDVVLATVDGIDDETLYRLTRIGHEEYSPLSVLENVASHDRDHLTQIRTVVAESSGGAAAVPAGIVVRPALPGNLPRLTEIYNHYVVNTAITFDLEPYTVEQRVAWFAQFADTGPHRLFVAEADGVVAGYAGTHQFRTKAAYDTTVETTIYLAPGFAGRGIGTALYAALFDAIEGEDLHVAIAGITLPNAASLALHTRFGFTSTGVMHSVGRKFGQYWDVAFYERPLA